MATHDGDLLEAKRQFDFDRAFKAVTLGAGALVLAILALIAWSLISQSWPALRESGWGLVSSKTWIPNDPDGGGPPPPPPTTGRWRSCTARSWSR